MMIGLHRAFEVINDSTRLHSFVALRKLDEFFRSEKSMADDLIANDIGIDKAIVLGGTSLSRWASASPDAPLRGFVRHKLK